MSDRHDSATGKASRRLDQWLWFARFAKSRSIAARLCASGVVDVNGMAVAKPNHGIKPGDIVSVPQGSWRRTIEVLALGLRRGPPSEAQTLYRETGSVHRADLASAWEPLLLADDD